MKPILLIAFLFLSFNLYSQELYVFSDPASNLPAKSLSVKLSGHTAFEKDINDNLSKRFLVEIMAGASKDVMLRFYATFGNMHFFDYPGTESSGFSVKYRFLSKDDLHKHFRMAGFLSAGKASVPAMFDELNLKGDNSGIEGGIIATQLWNRLALSVTASHIQAFDSSRKNKSVYLDPLNYQSLNYSLSGGYLVLPVEYRDYRQTNLNVYLEFLAQHALDNNRFYLDMAPAIQFIFNSNAKLNIGYRFELTSNMRRMNNDSWLLSFERTFLDAFSKKK